MILIVTEQEDISTYEVARWLELWNAKYNIINDKTELIWQELILNNEKTELSFYKNKNLISSSDFYVCWMRRLFINFNFSICSKHPDITDTLLNEAKTLSEFIHFIFEDKKMLGSFINKNSNKLKVLELAKKTGLLIPNSSVITDINLLKQNIKCKKITKVLSPGFPFKVENNYYGCYTELVDLRKCPENNEPMFPSFIQNAIEKRYEIRVFYLDGEMFAMAIFSQKDKKTKTDLRNYNYEKPNRNVPFSLPTQLKKQIKKFMNLYQLNTGSLDFIYTTDHKFIFLEVNPVGQFDFVSKYCNYFIEKDIAKFLIKNDHE